MSSSLPPVQSDQKPDQSATPASQTSTLTKKRPSQLVIRTIDASNMIEVRVGGPGSTPHPKMKGDVKVINQGSASTTSADSQED